MKKNTILKVLSVVLLLTFVLSAVLLTGCNGKLKEDVAKAQTDVATAQTDIENAKSTLATLRSELTELKAKVDKSALSTTLDEKVDDLQGQINDLETDIDELERRIGAAETALEEKATKEELTNTEAALQSKDTELEGEIDGLSEDLTKLTSKVNDLADKVDKLAASTFVDFVKATDLISKEYIEDENGDSVLNPYSMYAFEKLVKDFNATDYFDDGSQDKAYDEYRHTIDRYYFRLARAISEQDVRNIFNELRIYYASLPTFEQRFEAELLRLEGRETDTGEIHGIVSLEKDQLKNLIKFHGKAGDKVTEAQESRYQAILGARAALEAAEEAAVATANNAVEAGLFTYDEETGTFAAVEVLYKPEVNQAINTIASEYDQIEATYFTNVSDGQKALYGVGPEALTGYSLNVGQIERFAYLTKAKTGAADEERFGLDEIELDTLPIVKVITNPLYSDKVGIDTDIAAIDEWAEDWEIAKDSENYKLIVTASFTNRTTEGYARLTYDAIKAAETYAAKMDAIYTEHVIGYVPVGDQTGNLAEELGKEIEAGAENVLYRRIKTELTALATAADKLHKAVAAVNEELEQPVDAANIAAMLGMGEGDGAKFNAIAMRAIALTQTKAAIDTITATLTQKQGKVSFSDGENILNGYQAQIDELFNTEDLAVYYEYFIKGIVDAVMENAPDAPDPEDYEEGEDDAEYQDALAAYNATIKESIKAAIAGAGLIDPEGFDRITFRYWDYNDDQEKVVDEDSVNYKNYVDMTEAFHTALADLLAEYNTLKQRIQEVYEDVKPIVKADDEAVKTLVNLQKVLWANKKVSALEGVNTPDFLLDDPDEPNGTISFQKFRSILIARALQLVNLAESANDECVGDTGLNARITALGDFNLNKTAEYKGVLVAVVCWIEDYLNINATQYFGETDLEVLDKPTMELPTFNMEEPEEPEEPDLEEPEEPTMDQPLEPTLEMPDPDDYPDGEQDPDYQQAFAAYSDAWAYYYTNKDIYDGAWDDYNTALGNYNTAWDNYNTAMDEYNTAMDEYNTAWDAYQNELQAYNTAWNAYNEYKIARDAYIRSNLTAEHISNLFEAVKDTFQETKEKDAVGDLNGEDGYILGIANFNYPTYPEEGNYKFIANFEAVITAAEDYFDTYELAYREWYGYTDTETDDHVNGVWDDIKALPAIANIRIHNAEIPAAYDRYTTYKTNYYAGNITDPQFNELEAYDAVETDEDLLGKKTELEAKEAAATALYTTIVEQAQDLLTYGEVPTDNKVEEILEKVAALRANIKKYRDNYCDKADTDQCKFVKADGTIDAELVGYKAQAKAQIVKVIVDGIYLEDIDYLYQTYHIKKSTSDRTTLKTLFCKAIDMKSSIGYVIDDYTQFFGMMVNPDLVPAPVIPEEPGDEPQAPNEEDYNMEDEEQADAYYEAFNEWENDLHPNWEEAVAQYQEYLDNQEYFDGMVEAYEADAFQYAYDYLYPID